MDEPFIFNKLPNVLVNIILNYTGKVTFRFGKYMDRIEYYDERYELLKKIDRPIQMTRHIYYIPLLDETRSGYILKYCIQNKSLKYEILSVNILAKGFITTNKKYEFDVNNNWSRIIDYIM